MFRRVAPLVACLLVLALDAPALAHPFGPPPTALVSAEGRRVVVHWQAVPDDAVAVGAELGLLPADLVDAYLGAPAGPAAPTEGDELALSRSAELREYLLAQIAVHQDGVRCRPAVEPIGNFVREGARTVHECPARVDAVDITIRMLHAHNPGYRTFAISGDAEVNPQQAVFGTDAPRHRWDFAAERATVPDTTAWWPLVLLVAAALVGVVHVTLRGGER